MTIRLLDFVEFRSFTRRWDQLGLNDEDDLAELQWEIMSAPKKAPVVRGTEGLRKIRFAPKSWRQGKRSSTRVLYVLFEDLAVVLIALIYAKNETLTISDSVKRIINNQIIETENELRRIKRLKRRRFERNEDENEQD